MLYMDTKHDVSRNRVVYMHAHPNLAELRDIQNGW